MTDPITPGDALEDLASYHDLEAEVEGLRACYLKPIAAHTDRQVRDRLALLEGNLSAALAALAALQELAR